MKMSNLTPADLQDFGAWAFNDRSGCQSLTDDVRMWNENHGHLLRLKDMWDLCDQIERCLELWEEHRNDRDKPTDQACVSECAGTLGGQEQAE